jgi:ATP-dependent DNA helicase RecQ
VQEDIIQNVIKGHNTFVIMPTGRQKQAIYQLPALEKLPGTAIVISPSRLYENQVDQLNASA